MLLYNTYRKKKNRTTYLVKFEYNVYNFVHVLFYVCSSQLSAYCALKGHVLLKATHSYHCYNFPCICEMFLNNFNTQIISRIYLYLPRQVIKDLLIFISLLIGCCFFFALILLLLSHINKKQTVNITMITSDLEKHDFFESCGSHKYCSLIPFIYRRKSGNGIELKMGIKRAYGRQSFFTFQSMR